MGRPRGARNKIKEQKLNSTSDISSLLKNPELNTLLHLFLANLLILCLRTMVLETVHIYRNGKNLTKLVLCPENFAW